MPKDTLWKELLKSKTLTQGWHLARLDEATDYIQDHFTVDMFANNLPLRIQDIKKRLQTDCYDPKALLQINVPKGNLGIRPGTKLYIDDKVVLAAITLLIAPILDEKLNDFVYSFRVKSDLGDLSNGLFKDQQEKFDISRLINYPYLKKSTITTHIDVFDPWSYTWPEFDQKSRELVKHDRVPFLDPLGVEIGEFYHKVA